MLTKSLISLTLLLVVITVITAHGKVKLTDVKTLTLYHGRMTTGRRTSPVPQIECMGGSANCAEKYLPKVVQCTNMGTDGFEVQWRCEADLASNVKFGRLDVNCEGYDYPNDKYVFQGSCGLRYTLDKSGKTSDNKSYGFNSEYSAMNGLSFLVFCVVICVVIYFFCISPSNNNHYGSAGDIPSSFPSAPSPPGFRPEYTDPPPYESLYRNKYPSSSSTRNDGPGFWTGLGAGGLMGYLFGSRTNQQTPYYENRSYNSPSQSTWFDSGHSSTTYRESNDRDESTTFRTATGFSGTSRR